MIIARAKIIHRRGGRKILASIKAVLVSHSIFDDNRPLTKFRTRLCNHTNRPNIKGHRIHQFKWKFKSAPLFGGDGDPAYTGTKLTGAVGTAGLRNSTRPLIRQ